MGMGERDDGCGSSWMMALRWGWVGLRRGAVGGRVSSWGVSSGSETGRGRAVEWRWGEGRYECNTTMQPTRYARRLRAPEGGVLMTT